MIAAINDSPRENADSTTLVCVFLRGGADTLNMLVPYGDDDYYRLRKSIAIARPGSQGGAVAIDGFYGFHPKLAPLLPTYREGRLTIVQGVGTGNPTGSHFDSQDQVEHGQAYGESLAGGWLGRYLQARGAGAGSSFSAVALGPAVPLTLAGAPIASALQSVDDVRLDIPQGRSKALAAVLGGMYTNAPGTTTGAPQNISAERITTAGLASQISRAGRQTLEVLARVEALKSDPYRPENGAEYPQDQFGFGLKEIARLIKSGLGLEAAIIDLPGWDTHFFQGSSDGQQAHLIDSLGRGLAAFDLDLLDRQNRVLLTIITEFGRRTYENGSLGTDHGRGFAMFVLANQGDRAIRGGRVIGPWPGLKEEQPGPGPGGLKVNFDFRSVLSASVSIASKDPFLGPRLFSGVMPMPDLSV
ncbi:MAG TPA: DUF1501 domain-containing protein [Blastocatellia bacterium]|nr:DUF1501 domain-containing protein [Blastocatellia bacterium]